MKSYLLLRDNQQSGPYTFQEIKRQNLYPTDLVWVEGKSNSWSYPTEINELSQFVTARTVRVPVKKKQVSTTSVAGPGQHVVTSSANRSSAPVYGVYEDVSRELYEGVKIPVETRRRKVAALNANIMALLLIMVGVGMGAYVVKSVVASFSTDDSPIASAEAREIQSINTESEHAAFAAQKTAVQSSLLTDDALQIAENVLPAKPTESERQQIIDELKPVLPETKEQKSAGSTTEVKTETTEQTTLAEAEAKEEPKETKKSNKDVRSQLQVSGSDFKVGMLGGVSDLDIAINNSSSSVVDKATVEVNYMKPNGSVVESKTVEVRNIQPGGSKKVTVPPSNRGVKVDYKIVDVDAQ